MEIDLPLSEMERAHLEALRKAHGVATNEDMANRILSEAINRRSPRKPKKGSVLAFPGTETGRGRS